MANDFVLYTREECHLCEQASRLLREMGVAFQEVDIDQDAALEARYGIKVPVLAQPAQCREICFPFGESEVRRFLAQ
jgi:glutaredoxin